MKKAFRVIYRGRVQGVGFRYSTLTISKKFDVAGYVKNLNDGSVELVAVCDEPTFSEFDSAIRDRFSGFLTSVEVNTMSEAGAYKDFSIRRSS